MKGKCVYIIYLSQQLLSSLINGNSSSILLSFLYVGKNQLYLNLFIIGKKEMITFFYVHKSIDIFRHVGVKFITNYRFIDNDKSINIWRCVDITFEKVV